MKTRSGGFDRTRDAVTAALRDLGAVLIEPAPPFARWRANTIADAFILIEYTGSNGKRWRRLSVERFGPLPPPEADAWFTEHLGPYVEHAKANGARSDPCVPIGQTRLDRLDPVMHVNTAMAARLWVAREIEWVRLAATGGTR